MLGPATKSQLQLSGFSAPLPAAGVDQVRMPRLLQLSMSSGSCPHCLIIKVFEMNRLAVNDRA